MKIEKFNTSYGICRNLALISAIAILVFCCINKAYSLGHVLDIECPGGEAMQAEKNKENQRNKEAHDKVRKNNQEGKQSSPKDNDKSNQWVRDNVAKSPKK